ncbi:hypothetical protein [Alkaliphilus serpentinus]|uniref:Uncharacterized protein n=1 Tax=Alkaliphilus serpentinus TaxID=1482731 RepID=A0A833HL83_9FIRM|nr:hypothetical protein [Alkaliphilus serpentinus]KAB3525457.1 hypothetical protein F8153_15340 [Alkaliphilus serpentinus]
MSDITIIYLLIIALFVAIAVLVATLLIYQRQKKAKEIKADVRYRQDFLNKSYYFFNQLPLIKNYIKRIRRHIEYIELSDGWTINRRTMKFTYISLGISFLMFLFLMLVEMNLYFFIISILTIYIVHNQIVRILVDRLENRLLIQFEKFIGDVRHHYHGHGMIDEAIYDTIEGSHYEISLHANKMYQVLTSDDVENEIDKYNDLAPNKFFKTFIALCYLVQKFGDQIIDGKSMFLSNLNHLKQEINLEILRREKLNYLFKSLSIIAISPVFFLKLIEGWALMNLPELSVYYNGAYGFVVEIILFFVIIISYQMINRMQNNSQEFTPLINRMEEFLLRFGPIRDSVDRLIVNNYGKSMKLDRLLKVTGSQSKVELFYLKRLTWALIGFVASLGIFLNAQYISRNNILDGHSSSSHQVEMKAEAQLAEFDKEYIRMFANKKPTYQEVEAVLADNSSIEDKQLLAITAKRIQEKLKVYNQSHFMWWQLIICIFTAITFYQIPLWLLLFRRKVQQMNMEDEVLQFHTIILMLMYIERIAVEDILIWMEEFSQIFKASIRKCLNNFEYGDFEALEELKIDEPFLPFTRLVENLQSASDKISIPQAFDELVIERGYYQEKRKQDNEIMVNKKGLYGKLIAFIPLGAVLFLYLLLPFTLFSISQLVNYSSEIKNAL